MIAANDDERLEAALDEALADSFPASDPPCAFAALRENASAERPNAPSPPRPRGG